MRARDIVMDSLRDSQNGQVLFQIRVRMQGGESDRGGRNRRLQDGHPFLNQVHSTNELQGGDIFHNTVCTSTRNRNFFCGACFA